MPIRRETRWLYPIDWPLISKHIRFEVAGPHGAGRCWKCGRPHGHELRVLPDGRWFDAEQHTWRDARGKEAAWPDMVDAELCGKLGDGWVRRRSVTRCR